jgi:hypothetical protein
VWCCPLKVTRRIAGSMWALSLILKTCSKMIWLSWMPPGMIIAPRCGWGCHLVQSPTIDRIAAILAHQATKTQ